MRWGFLVLIMALAAASPARAQVGADEVARAAAELERARAAAGEAGAAWRAEHARVREERAVLERLMADVAAGEVVLGEARAAARERARILYLTAGAANEGNSPVRAAYAAAVGRADQEAVNALRAALEDLERLREEVHARAAAHRLRAARLADLEAAAGPALAAAEAEYRRLRIAWEGQEAARQQQEGEAAVTTATSLDGGAPSEGGATTAPAGTPPATAAATTTTTTPPGVAGGPFAPAVERWRALVGGYFPAELVDQALAVIACESLGDPAVVNPLSGTAGLFQHHPLYWPERAAAAGFPGATAEEPEANVAAAAWLVGESVAAGLDPWFFWACRP